MIGSVQQKPGLLLGHDDLADNFGVNIVPIRGTLGEAQAEAQSTLHRHRGAQVARLPASDHEQIHHTGEQLETLACRWAGVDTIFLFHKGAK